MTHPFNGAEPISDHYDGRVFYNLNRSAVANKGMLEVLRWKLGSTAVAWPKERVNDVQVPDLLPRLKDGQFRITFINHATVLIQGEDFNLLTDPVLSEKLGPLGLLNLKRYRAAGLDLKRLPKIDCVFVSHNHYDHLDMPTLKAIETRDHPQFIVPLGVGRYLSASMRQRTTELDWWQTCRSAIGDLKVTLVPAQHWSKRGLTDANATLWGGAVFEAKGRSVFFAGDTGYAGHFKMIADKFGAVDVALLPIGAYEPRWFMKEAHMNPMDAVLAHEDLRSKFSIAIHFGTFRLTDEGIHDPEKELKKARQARSIDEARFVAPRNGQTFLLAD